MYRGSSNFTDKSNREAYLKKIAEKTKDNPKKRWCKNHPKSYWGESYDQCVEGFQKGERCELGEL